MLVPKVDEKALSAARVNLEKPVTVVTMTAIKAAEERMKRAAVEFGEAMERAMAKPTSVVLQKYARIAEAKLVHHTKAYEELTGPKAGTGRVQHITDLFTRLSGNSANVVERFKELGQTTRSFGGTLKGIFAGGGGGGAGAAATGGGAATGAATLGAGAVMAGVAIAVVAAVGAVVGAVKYIHETMTAAAGLAGMANPATLIRFNQALDDTWAVIGARLIPVVNFWTDVMRTVGDVFQTMLPSTKDVRAVMAEYKPMLKEVRVIAGELAPYIRMVLVKVLTDAAKAVRVFVTALRLLIGMVRAVPFIGEKIFGKEGEEATPLKSSFGAAGRGASFGGIEDIHKQAIIGALSAGRNLDQETADNTKKTAELLEQIAHKGIRENVNQNLGPIGRLVPNALLAF